MPGQVATDLRNIELTDELSTRALAHFTIRFTAMKSYRDQLDTKVMNWLKVYNAIPGEKQYKWMSNIFVPYAYSLISQMVPRIRATLFGSDNFIKATAHTADFLKMESSIASWFMGKLRSQKFFKKARDLILASFKYPISIMKLRWVEKEETSIKTVKMLGFIPMRISQKKKRKMCELDVVDYFSFWWDPNGTDEETCKDFAHRILRDRSYINQMAKNGTYKNCKDIDYDNFPNDIAELRQDIDIYRTDVTEKREGISQVELIEYWGRFDFNNDGIDEDVIITVANRTKVIKIQKNNLINGMKAFKTFKPLVEDSQFTGMPPLRMAEPLQGEINTVRNQRIDNRTLILRKFFKARRDADINSKEVVAGPGNIIWLDNMDDLVEIPIKDVSTTVNMEEGVAKQDLQLIMGSSDYLALPDSATGASIVQSEVASRYQDMLVNLKIQFEELFNMILTMYRQFAEDEDIFKMIDPKTGEPVFGKITPEDLNSEYNLSVDIKMTAESSAKQANWVNLLNTVGKSLLVNQKEMIRAVLEAFDVKNIVEILTPVQEGAPPAGGNAGGILPPPMDPTLPGMNTSPESDVKDTPQLQQVREAQAGGGTL